MVNLNVPYSRPNYALKTLVNELYERWGLPTRAPEYVTGYKSASNLTGHNADSNGIVHAVDLFFGGGSPWTEGRGWELAELLRKEGPKGLIDGHPDRMYYIIYRDHIAGDFSNWEWVGSGYGHWDHVHVSTCDMYWGDPAPVSALDYDSKAPWNLWAVTNTSTTTTTKGDWFDMATEADLLKALKTFAASKEFRSAGWAFSGARKGQNAQTMWNRVVSTAEAVVRLEATSAAQLELIKQLALGKGLDPAELEALVEGAVKKAMTGVTFTAKG